MNASIDEIVRFTVDVTLKMQRDYAVLPPREPWFAARVHSYADRGLDTATAAFMLVNENAKPKIR